MAQRGGLGRWARSLTFAMALVVPTLAAGAPAHAGAPADLAHIAAPAPAGGEQPAITTPTASAADARNLGAFPRVGLGAVLVALVLWSRARHQRPATL